MQTDRQRSDASDRRLSASAAGCDPRTSLFWPAAALVVLLSANVIYRPSFFSVRIRDGHLYGSLIDILDRAPADPASRWA